MTKIREFKNPKVELRKYFQQQEIDRINNDIERLNRDIKNLNLNKFEEIISDKEKQIIEKNEEIRIIYKNEKYLDEIRKDGGEYVI